MILYLCDNFKQGYGIDDGLVDAVNGTWYDRSRTLEDLRYKIEILGARDEVGRGMLSHIRQVRQSIIAFIEEEDLRVPI